MTSIFHNALAAGQAAVRAATGETVTYRRASLSVVVTAAPGTTRVEVDDASGMVVTARVRDFLVAAAELVLDGAMVEPEDGDLIRLATPAGDVEVYEVAPIGGEKCFSRSGTAGTTLRIHTRHIDTESE